MEGKVKRLWREGSNVCGGKAQTSVQERSNFCGGRVTLYSTNKGVN